MRSRLAARGWSEDELEHLDNNFSFRSVDSVLIVLLLLLLVFAVVAVPYTYVLLAQVIPSSLLYASLLLVSSALGVMFALLLSDIDLVTRKHHTALMFSIPVACVLAFVASFSFVTTGLFEHNVYIAAVLYAVGFVASYAAIVKKWM
ncbi:MAG: hypothetical protein ACMXYD_04330 [Candidatus Woesearchaeota archaeon]